MGHGHALAIVAVHRKKSDYGQICQRHLPGPFNAYYEFMEEFGREALLVIGVATSYAWDVVESAQRCQFKVSCVDNYGGANSELPNLTTLSAATDRSAPYTVGLSSAVHRPTALISLSELGFQKVMSLVDPTAIIASTVTFGHGSYVNAGAVIASHVQVGCGVNINRSASIGHDSSIGWGSSIGPGVTTGGEVNIGQNTLIGIGASILPGIKIGSYCTVGAGAVVTRNVADGAVVVGNPARPLKEIETKFLDNRKQLCPFC